MKIISNNNLGAQVKKYPTTSQGVLFELKKSMEPSIITLITGLTPEQIESATNGGQNAYIFSKLISLWAYLNLHKEEDARLGGKISEKEMEFIFCPSPDNKHIANYADKHGI
jgi:hypothetical protein